MREIREVDFSVGLRAGANALAAWQSVCLSLLAPLPIPFQFGVVAGNPHEWPHVSSHEISLPQVRILCMEADAALGFEEFFGLPTY